MIRLTFEAGTLLVEGDAARIASLGIASLRLDPRVDRFRAPARAYRFVILELKRRGIEYRDDARAYGELKLRSTLDRTPFPYQREAVDALFAAGGAGVVVLPTGAGKTYVAQLAIERAARSAIVITPTLDLMQQWYSVLTAGFDTPVGLVGGGYYDLKPLTVTTYDSAYLYMDRFGAQFGFVVFDECHHLPGPSIRLAAESCLAPYRLGLSATPERQDGLESDFDALIGPIVYRQEIKALAGNYLAEYETQRITVTLSEAEQKEYDTQRAIYREYVTANRISMASPHGFQMFLRRAATDAAGRRALLAYRAQKRVAEGSEAKLRLLQRLLAAHSKDRVIVFTADNATVHEISRRFLVPVITHQTKVKERKEILERFNSGVYPFLATSKVLNEGVDVPAASVAIVLSGSGSVREHVQRLGRILRRADGKRATLYEVVAAGTAEEFVSSRRRQHDAYR
jgi:superfamily II DNA or RNA helicase